MTIEETVSAAVCELFAQVPCEAEPIEPSPVVGYPVVRYFGAAIFETVFGLYVQFDGTVRPVETVSEALALIRLDCAGRRASSRFSQLAGN